MFSRKTNRILVTLVSTMGLVTFPVAASAQPSWRFRGTDGPTPRAHNSMVYDSCRGVVVLYGGENFADEPPTLSRDTWEWNGSQWSLRSTDGPTVQFSFSMAFDSDRCVTVLFGGNHWNGSIATYLRETWEWDGTTWTQRCQNCPPTQRHQFGMAYNSAGQRVVIFGGWSGGSLLNDVWEWDGTTWTQVTTTVGPTPRTEVAMAYDETRDRIVLFGGRLQPVHCSTLTNETWELDMSSSPAVWKLIPTPDAPSPRVLTRMVFNPTDSKILLFGGNDACSSIFSDTWVYDATWQEANASGPSARWGYAMAFDELRDEFVLFGGYITPTFLAGDPREYSAETWSYGKVDTDGDGVPDEEDACPDSDFTGTIVIDGCETDVVNELLDGGCTMADRVGQCANAGVNNALFVCCVAHLTNEWKASRLIAGADKGAIQSCAAQADGP